MSFDDNQHYRDLLWVAIHGGYEYRGVKQTAINFARCNPFLLERQISKAVDQGSITFPGEKRGNPEQILSFFKIEDVVAEIKALLLDYYGLNWIDHEEEKVMLKPLFEVISEEISKENASKFDYIQLKIALAELNKSWYSKERSD